MNKFSPLVLIVLLSTACFIENGSALDSSLECEVCRQVFTYVYGTIEKPATQQSIENVLDTVCDKILSGEKAATCEKYVNEYTPEILNTLAKTTDPDEMCILLTMC
ncbi:prosaposin-like [Panonychus citri]|uniref:prosaposin-like n=1 Tax=Panonychus citri TaxID=50023 RepID=UPI002307213D|nr:prosaposin-like [Panonychus citri]